MLHVFLKHCGFQLRIDDASALSDMITVIQERSKAHESNRRVQYILDLIGDIKANKRVSVTVDCGTDAAY